ncbi:MAG TPA: ABC transporter ATP-binding protein [Acidimicrobiales bacterium]|nr:ABC transporter ATP-binding protein [Acidimicrobiales bacterium]
MTQATGQPAGATESTSSREPELLRLQDIVTWFPRGRGQLPVRAVDGVSLSLRRGEALGLVGESGCGKTTLARTAVRLLEPTSGRVIFKGEDITGYRRSRLTPIRRQLQMVFQDPFASLNPRMTAGQIVAQPLRIHHRYRQAGGEARVAELLDLVGLDASHVGRFPHEFSGGQRQRIGIARALALDPEVIVLDEPVSSLDVSIRGQIVNLLADLRDELGVSYLFIAHDLSIVRHLCDRVAVMYLGKIVEIGDRHDIYRRASHPYTQSLLSAVPVPDPARQRRRSRIVLQGEAPDPTRPPSGCRFRTRCWKAKDRCAEDAPDLVERLGTGHPSACHFAEVVTPKDR